MSTESTTIENGEIITREEKENLIDYMVNFLQSYEYEDVKRFAVEIIVNEWLRNKGWLIRLFKNHPNYNGKYQIVLKANLSRIIESDSYQNFISWLNKEFQADKIKERDIEMKPLKIDGFYLWEIQETLNKLRKILSDISDLNFLGFSSIIINGMNVKYYQEEYNRFSKKTDDVNVLLKNGNYVILNDLSDTLGMIDNLYEKEKVLKAKSIVLSVNNLIRLLNTYKPCQFIDEEMVASYNMIFPELKSVAGQKLSRVINKICKMIGVDKHPDYNKEFAKFADSINPISIPMNTILSVHPIDYWSMSFGNSWSSCHTIDKYNVRDNVGTSYGGCYSGGTTSYMLDKSSVVFYTVDSNYVGNDFELQDKVNRNMFHIGEEKIVQGRVYPQSTDGFKDVYKIYREIVQKIISDCWKVPNLWTNVKGTSECENVIFTEESCHYKDYACFNDCNVSYLKNENEERNYTKIHVGHLPICPCCGSVHDNDENIMCEYCSDEIKCCVCDSCDDRDSMYNINGDWYCEDCCCYDDFLEEMVPCTSDEMYEVKDYGMISPQTFANNRDIFTICDETNTIFKYDLEDCVSIDGHDFIDVYAAESYGYRYVDSSYDWYWCDEVEYCSKCGCWVLIDDYNYELDMCKDCAEELTEENEAEENNISA